MARNATGLTNPAFFNWEVNAEQEVVARDPDAVVMAIGGNDGFNVQTSDGSLYNPGDAGWETEFARRVAVVSSVLSGDGERPVYWVPPPTARDPEFNDIYASQNRAVERATEAISALRYVDVYSTLNQGRYSDSLRIDGEARACPAARRRALHARGRGRGGTPYPRRHGRGLPRPACAGGSMRRGLAVLAAGLALAPTAAAAERSLLVNGDSLAEGTRPYVPPALPGWRVKQSTSVSRHAYEGDEVMRRYGSALARVIHVSLGTNDDPGDLDGFRAAIGDVMRVAGGRRCVVWANIVRPPYRGVSYRGYNRVLGQEARNRDNLRVLNWVRMVREHPEWLADDGVHVSAEGYQARAEAVARAVRRCRPAAPTRA